MPADQQSNPLGIPVKLDGLNSTSPATLVYPDSPDLQNVRFGKSKEILTRTGFAKYNTTAMPATTRAITGVAELNRRDATTRYTIVADQEKIFSVPTSGAWTTLASTLGASATDYWDFAVFNNELICVNGVSTPQITDGTAGGTTALTASSAVQARTAMTTACSNLYGLHRVTAGTLVAVGGATVGGAYDGPTQRYDSVGDAWQARTRVNVNRDDGAGFLVNGRIYATTGLTTGGGFTGTTEEYDPVADTWRAVTSITVSLRQIPGQSSNSGGFIQSGNNSSGAAGWVQTNYYYDPVVDVWSTKTAMSAVARRQAAGGVVTGVTHVTSGRTTVGPDNDSSLHDGYNPWSDAWTSLTAITNGRRQAQGATGLDNLQYVAGGTNSSGVEQSTIQKYTTVTNAWAQATATLGTARFFPAMTQDSYWMYFSGGAVGANASAVTERLNTSPAAPTAYYVETFGGYVFLARTSSYPSRVFYAPAGESRLWPSLNYFDVFPDDGDWITGMFVFDGRLYVTKNKRMCLISGTVFDPDPRIGNQRPILLPNVPGCVSNRSIVVTDLGVFYLSADGFRGFNGARSDLIGDKVKSSLDGYVQSRMSAVCGLWVKKYNEVWWSLTSSGTTHNVVLAYHVQHHTWTRFVGMNIEAMASVDDANYVPQILFGTGDTQGFLFTADSTVNDNGAAINAYYQTGWFPISQQTREAAGRFMNVFIKRSGNWNVQIDAYRNYGSTAFATPGWPVQLNTLSGTYGDAQFFQDATDQLAVISMGLDGHHGSLKFTVNAVGSTFELYAIFVQGHDVRRAGRP